jgi:hypothetical protein
MCRDKGAVMRNGQDKRKNCNDSVKKAECFPHFGSEISSNGKIQEEITEGAQTE